MKQTVILLTLLLLLFQNCMSDVPSKDGSKSIDHEQWSVLLNKYVGDNGNVDYKGFKADSVALQNYLDLLTENPPDENTWSTDEQIAYWINVYNAFTIKLVIEHYPLESIKDIGSSIQIPFVNSPWDIKLIEIEGEKLDLNNVEHSILRKKFNEPRIHFAINCASYSCPKLRNEAYTSELLNTQLQEQAIDFINDPQRNIITEDNAEVSKLFSWFTSDFTKEGTLKNFINQFAVHKISSKTEITYLDYNWKLNEK